MESDINREKGAEGPLLAMFKYAPIPRGEAGRRLGSHVGRGNSQNACFQLSCHIKRCNVPFSAWQSTKDLILLYYIRKSHVFRMFPS